MKYFIIIVAALCIITFVNVIIESYKENRRISFSNYQLKDMRADSKISKIWSEKAEFQQELIHKQESELEEFGEILNK